MGARNRVVVLARQATQPDGIGSLESILGLLESLKIRALFNLRWNRHMAEPFQKYKRKDGQMRFWIVCR
jgi:hypothetical protein